MIGHASTQHFGQRQNLYILGFLRGGIRFILVPHFQQVGLSFAFTPPPLRKAVN